MVIQINDFQAIFYSFCAPDLGFSFTGFLFWIGCLCYSHLFLRDLGIAYVFIILLFRSMPDSTHHYPSYHYRP